MKQMINWILRILLGIPLYQLVFDTLKDKNDKFSSRKITALVATIIYILTSFLYFNQVTDPFYLLLGLCLHPIFVLILFGIITAQHIIEFKKKSE